MYPSDAYRRMPAGLKKFGLDICAKRWRDEYGFAVEVVYTDEGRLSMVKATHMNATLDTDSEPCYL